MVGFLYYGRLEKEKGVDSLITALKKLQKTDLHFEIFIFWRGSLEEELLALEDKRIHFFGRKPLHVIEKYLSNIDYCLMPSEFLETFGLSALNALAWGIPVIGYRKGGMEKFVFWDLNLYTFRGKNTAEKIISCINMLCAMPEKEIQEKKEAYQYQALLLVDEYSKNLWYQRFMQLSKFSDEKKKIVLVSDFINKIGGIETYINDVKDFLEIQGFEVVLWGKQAKSGFLGTLQKYFGILSSPFGWCRSYRFKKFLLQEKPDLIRFHSLLRGLGKGVVESAEQYKQKEKKAVSLWMMYHDFGYFYPYPHSLFEKDQCKCPLSLSNFLTGQKGLKKILAFGKYLLMKGLVKTLKKTIDLHLTPSDFMREMVIQSYQLSEKKVKTFPHFIQDGQKREETKSPN